LRVFAFALFGFMGCAAIHYLFDGAGVVSGISWGAPYTRNAKLTTSAFRIVVRTINLSPSMASSNLYLPTLAFCVLQRCLNVFLRMFTPSHVLFLVTVGNSRKVVN
jgi:hypothetical protein